MISDIYIEIEPRKWGVAPVRRNYPKTYILEYLDNNDPDYFERGPAAASGFRGMDYWINYYNNIQS